MFVFESFSVKISKFCSSIKSFLQNPSNTLKIFKRTGSIARKEKPIFVQRCFPAK